MRYFATSILLILIFTVFAFIPLILGATQIGDHDVTYKGTLTLDEEQYTTFKTVYAEALIAKNIFPPTDSHYLQVLSSDPPIVVIFSLKAPEHYYFPYGERSGEPWMPFSLALALTIWGSIATAVFIICLWYYIARGSWF